MFIAQDNDKNKISIDDAIPGGSYICPVCGNPVVVKAANSPNIRTHFAHKRNTVCFDDWQHDMSEWHFAWQSNFPIENREVVVENSGVLHRADVLINETVIEFQHSPISTEAFEARNFFYKSCGYRVVWLFDATDKMKIDECEGLVWKRKNVLFDGIGTAPDAIYVQHFLPDSNDNILCMAAPSPKKIRSYPTVCPIGPENFLKEYGAIQDDNILSVGTILEKTKLFFEEVERSKRAYVEKQRNSSVNMILRSPMRKRGRRRF